MHNLLRKKRIQLTITGIITLFSSFPAIAQLRDAINLPNSDEKFYHIGIVVMGAQSRFQINQHPYFLQQDSVLSVYPENTTGLGLGGMHTFRISDRFQLRAVFPQLIFVSQALTYQLKYPDAFKEETPLMTQSVESIHLGLPVQVKFRSDRIRNFRVYMMGGFKIETDLSSKARAKNTGDQVKLKKFDYGIEAGIGFSFYMPFFILSPELKISNGLGNIHSRAADVKFSNVIDKISSRMVIFSLIFEG
ncbi:MAG TPA: porin family protein [Chitinophagaceae bacterium]|nr:porin family protein [Chitinophagaceae bacterium]